MVRRPAQGRAIDDEAGFAAARAWVSDRLLAAYAVFSSIAPEIADVARG